MFDGMIPVLIAFRRFSINCTLFSVPLCTSRRDCTKLPVASTSASFSWAFVESTLLVVAVAFECRTGGNGGNGNALIPKVLLLREGVSCFAIMAAVTIRLRNSRGKNTPFSLVPSLSLEVTSCGGAWGIVKSNGPEYRPLLSYVGRPIVRMCSTPGKRASTRVGLLDVAPHESNRIAP